MTNEEIYAQAYAEAEAAETARIKAILGSPEARCSPDLAQYFAFDTFETAARALAVMRAYPTNLPDRRAQASLSYEDRKRAAGAIGLAPLVGASASDIWDQAIARAHMKQGIENPELGATGRKLQ